MYKMILAVASRVKVVAFALALAFVSMFTASPVRAAGMADLFTAVDISTLAASVTAILVGFIGVSLLFVGVRYLRKSGVK